VDRTIPHIDMDAFFAAIEVLDHPGLRGKPVIVGGTTNRGVVSTASYEARTFGIHSAMPIFKAREKCPGGVFLPVNMKRYKDMSGNVMKILEDFTPLVERVSIDEAYLDITGMEGLLGNPEQIALRIKERIYSETRLTCSIGIAPNKFLAKIASDMHKPDGLTIIKADEVDAFLATLPVERIPGVGKSTVETLKRHGIKKAGEIKAFSKDQLLRRFGKFGLRLHELARGADSSPVVPLREIKSISAEETLPYDTGDLSLLSKKIQDHADNVAGRLRNHGLKGKTITLKIKFSDFTAVTKAQTIASATDSSKMIFYNALQLLADQPLKKKVRLIGVEVSNLLKESGDAQMSLFPIGPDEERERKLDKAIDEIREKFGRKVIKRGGA
jgi:DNA polymerase-4